MSQNNAGSRIIIQADEEPKVCVCCRKIKCVKVLLQEAINIRDKGSFPINDRNYKLL
jgi:hypothetical protein